MRVENLIASLRGIASQRREDARHRFRGPYDAVRLFVLSIILIDLAIIAFANAFLNRLFFNYWPGMASFYGGLLVAIIIIRLGRPSLYWDWLVTGLLQVSLGLVLASDPDLTSTWSSALFFALLLLSAAMFIWVGIAVEVVGGRISLVAGGLASVVCVAGFTIDRVVVINLEPDVVVATQLLLFGLAIGGLGLSLRKPVN